MSNPDADYVELQCITDDGGTTVMKLEAAGVILAPSEEDLVPGDWVVYDDTTDTIIVSGFEGTQAAGDWMGRNQLDRGRYAIGQYNPDTGANETPLSDAECREQALAGIRDALAGLQRIPAASLDAESHEAVREMVENANELERSLANESDQRAEHRE